MKGGGGTRPKSILVQLVCGKHGNCWSEGTGAMKSTKVQTLGANMICVRDWSCMAKKLANTTTATGPMWYIATYSGNGCNGSDTG